MKKLILLISSMLLFGSTVAGAAGITVEPEIDYDNSIIKISCTTEAKYNQALSVVLYEGNTMGKDLTKFIKIAEFDADSDGNAYVELQLAKDVPSGEYLVSVAGGGIQKTSGEKVITYINQDKLGDIIQEFNSATESNIKETFEKYADIFTLPSDDTVYSQFLSVRKEDCNNNFTGVNEIVDSLKIAKLLNDINRFGTASDILNYFNTHADELGIDINDKDYKKSEMNIATAFLKLKKGKDLLGRKSFENTYKEAKVIGIINSCNVNELTEAIKQYADVIGISVKDYESSISKYTALQVNKAFHDKQFDSCAAILTAYNNRIKDLSGNNNNSTPGGGGGGGGGTTHKTAISSPVDSVYVEKKPEESLFTDFIDLLDAAWAEDSIKSLASKGIVSGYEDKSFKPNNLVSREEFVTIVVRAYNVYNSKAKCTFSDVKESDWCYPYVASAEEKKYVSGIEEGVFGKGRNISRQDAATILYKVGLANGKYFKSEEVEFADSEDIAEYAKEAVVSLTNAAVINGFDDSSFKPLDSLTRAQAVKMIESLLNL